MQNTPTYTHLRFASFNLKSTFDCLSKLAFVSCSACGLPMSD